MASVVKEPLASRYINKDMGIQPFAQTVPQELLKLEEKTALLAIQELSLM